MADEQVSTNGAGGFSAHVPPPPSEVTVRTLESDIASMGASGGVSPKPRPVKFSHKIDQEESARVTAGVATGAPMGTVPQATPAMDFFSSKIFLALSLFVLLAVVFLAGYYVIYPLLNPAPAPVQQKAAAPAGTVETLEHKSFFTQPVDGIFTLDASLPVQGMQADRDKVNALVGGLTGNFFELEPEDSLSQPVFASDFFTLIGANILKTDFLNANFEKDFTMFLYKDKSALLAGYILKLKTGETPILLKNDVMELENASSSWANLFVMQTGTPAQQFRDDLLSGQPVRVLDFSNPSSTLAYGWFLNKYLIISTSLDGMKDAVLHF